MNFQDPFLWLTLAISLLIIYYTYSPKKDTKVIRIHKKKMVKYTSFELSFIEIEKLAWLSSTRYEREEVTRLIYLFKDKYKDNPETRFNAQILEGINNRVRKYFLSQYQPLN